MIKDMVVNLNVGAEANAASDYAISVAAALDAHLTGIVLLYGPIVPVSHAGYVPPELEVIERHNQTAIEASRESFMAASTRAGIKAESLMLSASLASASNQFGQIARRFDMAVVAQAEPETNPVNENIIEAALFDSGGALIIVPYIQKVPLTLEHVMICWDGGRASVTGHARRHAVSAAGQRHRGRHRHQRAWQTGSNRTCRYRGAFGSPWVQG
jgi:hypothetical protein